MHVYLISKKIKEYKIYSQSIL